MLFTFLPCICFPSSSSSSSFEEVYLVINNHKTNDFESLHVEMYHYRIGNRGIIFVNPCSSCTTDPSLSQQCIMNEDN